MNIRTTMIACICLSGAMLSRVQSSETRTFELKLNPHYQSQVSARFAPFGGSNSWVSWHMNLPKEAEDLASHMAFGVNVAREGIIKPTDLCLADWIFQDGISSVNFDHHGDEKIGERLYLSRLKYIDNGGGIINVNGYYIDHRKDFEARMKSDPIFARVIQLALKGFTVTVTTLPGSGDTLHGGQGGWPFSLQIPKGWHLKRIEIGFSPNEVQHLDFVLKDSAGSEQRHTGMIGETGFGYVKDGQFGKAERQDRAEFSDDEHIATIFGRAEKNGVIVQLGFKSNKGRNFGPWGTTDKKKGEYFQYQVPGDVGPTNFFIRSGKFIDAIAVYP